MAQQTGSLQAFRAPLPPESLEGHGDKEGKARGKKSVGETNLSSLDTISNGYGRVRGGGVGCVGSGCKPADTWGRSNFQGDMWLRRHSMPLPCFVQYVFASSAASNTGNC